MVIPAFHGISLRILGTFPGIIGRMLGNSELELSEIPKEYLVRPYFVVTEPVLELRVHATSIAVGQLDVEIGGTSAAWLYNMVGP